MMKIKMRVFCWLLPLFCAIRTEERLVVTGAHLPISAYAGQDVILNCSVDTHVPLKELEVEWIKTKGEILVLLFAEGENRPESQHERFRGRAEFFSEEIPKGNFSLKLRDVKTEDKGEFMCRVHTDRESGNATVWLRGLGFSSLHRWVLGLTIAAAVFAVLSCIPAVWCIIEKGHYMSYSFRNVERNRTMLLYCLQVSVPCILISIAFAIWGYIEGSVGEAFVGSAINFMRILILFRVAPYIKILHGTCYRRFTYMALPLDNLVITTGVNSVVLQTFLIYRTPGSEAKAVTGILFGIVFLLSLLAVYSGWTRIGPFVFMCQTIIIVMEILLLFTIRGSMFSLTRFILLFLSLGSIIVVAVFHVLKSRLRRTRYGYLCDKVLLVLHFILQIIFSFQFLDLISEKDKERPALMCFIAFLFILTAAASFQRRRSLPAVPHILVYAFGSAVLSVLNSVAIAAEVILKAEKGERTVDLRLIVFPLEFFFLAFWLVLQIYAYCLRKKKASMIKELELICLCCTTRGQSPASSQQNQELQTFST